MDKEMQFLRISDIAKRLNVSLKTIRRHIISGKLKMLTAKVDKNGKLIGKTTKEIISKNILIEHKPYCAHAFKALEKSNMLAFVNGIRGGKNYEKDTFRLKNKLIV